MPEFTIRRFITQINETYSEAGVESDLPLRKAAVGAVIHNPYAGRYVEDLSDAVDFSVGLAEELGKRAVEALGEAVQSYGKGGIVGVDGEQEHAVMFVTTPFGNGIREAVGGGAAWISSATVVGSAGTSLLIPLAHKDALFVRANYDAFRFYPGDDTPRPDEVVVVVAVANRGRLNHRLGGLSADEITGEDGLR